MGEFRTEEEIRLTSIDLVIKSLGTMVMIPEYESDTTNIGKKIYLGPVQQPILIGKYRDQAIEKLSTLISEL